MVIEAIALSDGAATGRPLVLDEPLSFWGGVDPVTGSIIDTHHPQNGESVAGRVLMLAHGRGSSSSSTVLAETIRNRVGPAAILLRTADPILALGCLVAQELYAVSTPVVVVDGLGFDACRAAAEVTVLAAGGQAELTLSGPR